MNWLADCIIRIKNAGAVGKNKVIVRGTKLCVEILKILKAEGFIRDYTSVELKDFKQAYEVSLSYYADVPLLKYVELISTPKNRVYKKSWELRQYVHDFKMCVVSTNRGIMTAKDAIESSLGGEALFALGVY